MTSPIQNGELGSSVRAKLNQLITRSVSGVSTLLADTTLTYTAGQPGSVAAGDVVRTEEEGFAYEVALAGASDQDISTAGGVKLYSLSGDVRAFGAVGDGVTDDTEAFDDFFAYDSGTVVKSIAPGSYLVEGKQQDVNNGFIFANAADFGVDRVKAIEASVPLGNCYITRSSTRTGFGVGQVQGEKAVEFLFEKDIDGFYIIDLVYYGDDYPISVNAEINATNFKDDLGNSIPNPLTISGDNAYLSSTEVDYTFEIPFSGTGLLFNYFADNRGGMWEVVVDGDTSNTVSVSTWKNPGVSQNSVVLFDKLSPGSHTAVFTFVGADPDNPPASGGPRGWLKFDDGTAPTNRTAVSFDGRKYEMNWRSKTLVSSKILEFAIEATVTGSGIQDDFVPSHGNRAGAVVVDSAELYVDGLLEASGLEIDTYPSTPAEIGSFALKQSYTAYSTYDTLKAFPMWDGVLTHSFSGGSLTVSHEFVTLAEITLGNAYSCMLAGEGEFVLADNGVEKTLTIGGTDEYSVGYTRSVEIKNTDNQSSFAVSVDSLSSTISINKAWSSTEPTLLLERASDVKLYYLFGAAGGRIPAGTRFSLVSRYAIKGGE